MRGLVECGGRCGGGFWQAFFGWRGCGIDSVGWVCYDAGGLIGLQMNNFTFFSPTRYIFGRGVQGQVGALAAELLGDKVLLVYGGGSAVRSGLLGEVAAALAAAGVAAVELGGVRPNPTDGPVRRGIELCRREGVCGIVAVGGGSVIDTAKAIAAGVLYDGDFWDFFAGCAVPERALPLGVVLTIPAAGSEGSGNAVITLEAERKKLSLRTEALLRPLFALINPELSFTLPPYQTACGVVDMMAHVLERYLSPTAGVVVTDRLCEGLLRAVMEEAPRVLAEPEGYEARANIMWAGTLAHNGVCGSGRQEDWASHFLEHEVSALYDVAHGAGLAVIFPAYLAYVLEFRPERVAMLARNVLGVVQEDDRLAAREGVALLKAFFVSIGMPVSLAELGIAQPDIERLVQNLHANKGRLVGGYYPLAAEDSARVFELAR